MTQAYPLAWPQGFPRTVARVKSRFKTSLSGAVRNVQDEFRLFGNDSGRKVESVVVSSNVTLMDDKPQDPGVACYFVWDGVQCCIPIDRYTTPEENLQAVALILEAERAKIRHGGLNIVRASFRGFAALPPPVDAGARLGSPWWQVLGVAENASLEAARAAYLKRVKTDHPDRGGDAAKFNMVVDAWRQAQEARSHA